MSQNHTNAVSQNWDRAKNFAKIAGVKPGIARSYLATLTPTEADALANAKRRDNPNLAPHLQAILTFTPPERQRKTTKTRTYTRRSLGNPTLAPRAGAPTIPTNGYTTLIALKDFCNNHGGIDKVQAELDTLRAIQF